jgi:F0F1-type ATP synthase epsilon subunit
MSDGTFQLKVFSGRGLEVEATVRSANVPSEGGELGFLANHCEFVGLLSTGIGEYIAATGGSTAQKFIASGGIVTFSNNVLTLLADTVDLPESLDLKPLSEDVSLLKTELERLSLFDPEHEALSQRVARIEAVKSLAGKA